MPRYTWGPDFSFALAGPVETAEAPAAPPKADVELVFSHVDLQTGSITLMLPAHDPATHVQPDRVHAILFPPADPISGDAEQALAGPEPKSSVALDPTPGGCEITLPRPDGAQPGSSYIGKTVLQFGS